MESYFNKNKIYVKYLQNIYKIYTKFVLLNKITAVNYLFSTN